VDRAAAPKSWKPAEAEGEAGGQAAKGGKGSSAGQHEPRKTVFVGNLDFKVGGQDWVCMFWSIWHGLRVMHEQQQEVDGGCTGSYLWLGFVTTSSALVSVPHFDLGCSKTAGVQTRRDDS
jgi:hypothetical protein